LALPNFAVFIILLLFVHLHVVCFSDKLFYWSPYSKGKKNWNKQAGRMNKYRSVDTDTSRFKSSLDSTFRLKFLVNHNSMSMEDVGLQIIFFLNKI
jgi:hypothetical protein